MRITLFSCLTILILSCNNHAKTGNNKKDAAQRDTVSPMRPSDGLTKDTVANELSVAPSKDAEPIKDTVFLQCLELSDTIRLMDYLREHEITPDKIEFGLYASSVLDVELYPKNKLAMRENMQRWQCGYFCVTAKGGRKRGINIGQINGQLAEFNDSSQDTRYIEPPLIGDTCMYEDGGEAAYQVVKDFFRLARSGKRELADKYILYPVVCRNQELQSEAFWKEYADTWHMLSNVSKGELNFIAFGYEFLNLHSYDRTGIRFSTPQRMGGDYYYYGDDPTPYTCGYYMWWIDHMTDKGTRYETTHTFYMRLINVNGEPRICSFFIESDKMPWYPPVK